MDEGTGADGSSCQVPASLLNKKECDQLHVGDYSPRAQAVGNSPIILEEQAVAPLPLFADSKLPNQDLTTQGGGAAAAVPAVVDNTEQSSDEEEDSASLSGPIDPEQCIASGTGITGGTAGSPVVFLIRTKDTSGRLVNEGGAYLVVTIEHQSKKPNQNSVPIQAQIVDNGNGSYKASYSVSEKGSYLVDVRMNGASIAGSPFPVYFSAPGPGEIPFESAGSLAAIYNTVPAGGEHHTARQVQAYTAMLQQQNSLAQQVAELRTAQKFQSAHTISAGAVAVAAAAARRLATGARAEETKDDSRHRGRKKSCSPGRGKHHHHHHHHHHHRNGSSKDSRRRRRSRSRSRERKRDNDRDRHHLGGRRHNEEDRDDDRQRHSSHRRDHSRSRDRNDDSTRREEDKAAKSLKSSEQLTMAAPRLQKEKEKQQPISGDELEDLLKELEDV
jgi:hypothetical protein